MSQPGALDPRRRALLLGAKLGALVGEHLGRPVEGRPETFPGGAVVRDGDAAWLLGEERPERALGQALAWGWQHGVEDLHLLVPSGEGELARRAGHFVRPPTVWRVEGRALRPAVPAPLPAAPSLDVEVAALAEEITAAGADPVVEHGVLMGEVAGLEVVRAVREDSGELRLEVGVGKHDREAFALVHGDRPRRQALAEVVGLVQRHRRPGAAAHPLGRLVPERALRERLLAEPGLVGARHLVAAAPPVPRPGVKEVAPAVAVGEAVDGERLVVVCSVGIDLDLVPFAADAREAAAPGAALRLAVPERDAHPLTRALAASLRRPAEVVGVPPADA